MTAWVYKPRGEIVEAVEWFTDIIASKGTEQRLALRHEPRRTFNFSHVLTDYEYTGALAIIRRHQGTNALQVPDWPQYRAVGAVSSGSSVYVDADLTYVDMGDTGLLWQSESRWETVSVSVDSNGTVLASVANSYTNALLIPLWDAVCPQGIAGERTGAALNRCSGAFITTENTDLSSTSYTQYRGHDVVPVCPIIGSLDESMSYDTSPFDNQQSALYLLRKRDYVDYRFAMTWRETSIAGKYELRQWIHSRRGRQKAFWLSSYSKDYEPAASVSGTTLTVYAPPGFVGIGHTVAFDIEVYEKNGTSNYRQVTAATTGTPVGGRDTLDLTLDTTLTVNLGDISRISFMRCARFDSDRIEFSHQPSAGYAVTVPCVEVPVP